MGDPEFPDWLPQRVAECVSRLEPGRIERGEKLSPEDDQAGEAEATRFIDSLEIPDCPQRCAQLFPRLWSAKAFLDRSLLRPKLRIWTELDRSEVLRILLLATWPDSGRAKWEKERPGGFKFG
jgi:hypothetical protein